MRLRRREEDTAPLSPYADDWVTAKERSILGDQEAARLAHERRAEQARRRPPFIIDPEVDLVAERSDLADEGVAEDISTAALDVLAGREALLDGLLMPFVTKGEAQ